MAGECFTLLEKDVVERSRVTIKVPETATPIDNEDKLYEYAFLKQIITPIYDVVAAVRNIVLYASRIWNSCLFCFLT